MTEQNPLRIVVGKEIRAMRESAGLTQQDLADVLGVGGRSWTYQVENGLIGISLENYIAVMDFLRDTPNKDHPAHVLSTHFKRRLQFV